MVAAALGRATRFIREYLLEIEKRLVKRFAVASIESAIPQRACRSKHVLCGREAGPRSHHGDRMRHCVQIELGRAT